jgi:signal peptidase II
MKNSYVYLLIAALVIVLDMSSKFFISIFCIEGQSITVAEDILKFTLVFNRGTILGLCENAPTFYVLFIQFIPVLLLIYFYIHISLIIKQGLSLKIARLSLMIFIGGFLGNFLDRIINDKVTDFIDVFYQGYIFNLADIFQLIGALSFLFLITFFRRQLPQEIRNL